MAEGPAHHMQECAVCGLSANAELAICPYCGATLRKRETTRPPWSTAARSFTDDGTSENSERLYAPLAITRRPARFFIRLMAMGIDLLALAMLSAALGMLTFFLQSTAGGKGAFGIAVGAMSSLAVLGFAIYNTLYLPGTRGGSIGKRLCGISMVNAEGGFLDTGQILLREVAKLVSAAPLMLGFLWVVWDAKGQGWHDKIVRSFVYYD